jgi:hypothetical protein
MGEPRIHDCDPDFRRRPKTNRYCWHCQRDLSAGSGSIVFLVLESYSLVHPKDREMVQCESVLIGPECLRKQKVPKDFVLR